MDPHLTRRRSTTISTSYVDVHTGQTTPYTISYEESTPVIPDATLRLPSPHNGSPNSFPASPHHDNAALTGFNQQPPVGQGPFWRTSPSYYLHPSTTFPRLQIHPLLDGEYQRGNLFFPLSMPVSPTQYGGPEVLNQPATWPPITRLQIICDRIPQWPINVGYNAPNFGSLPPITVGDILSAVWHNLHEQVSHEEWAKLNVAQETEVTRAFTKRCKFAANQDMMVRVQGVKKVDYLLETVWFKGLARIGESYEQMLLVVA